MRILIQFDGEKAQALKLAVAWMAGQTCELHPELSLETVIRDTRQEVVAILERQGSYLGQLKGPRGKVVGSVMIKP